MGRLTNATMDIPGLEQRAGDIFLDRRGGSGVQAVLRVRRDLTVERFEGNRHERRQIIKQWTAEGYREHG